MQDLFRNFIEPATYMQDLVRMSVLVSELMGIFMSRLMLV